MEWGQVFAAGGIAATALGFVAYGFRDWFVNRLKRSLDHDFNEKLAFQRNVFDRNLAEMRSQHEIEVERLRSDLRIDAFRNETRFSKLHDKRASVIADLYAALKDMRTSLYNYVTNDVDMNRWDEYRQGIRNAAMKVGDVYHPNEIFLPASTCEMVDAYLLKCATNVGNFEADVHRHGGDRSRFHSTWSEIIVDLASDSKELFESLRTDFRHLLGDDAPPAAPTDEAD